MQPKITYSYPIYHLLSRPQILKIQGSQNIPIYKFILSKVPHDQLCRVAGAIFIELITDLILEAVLCAYSKGLEAESYCLYNQEYQPLPIAGQWFWQVLAENHLLASGSGKYLPKPLAGKYLPQALAEEKSIDGVLGQYTCRGAVTICKRGRKGRFLNMQTSLMVSQCVVCLI